MTDEPIEIGKRFGDYEITGRLGAGGMGEVFRARDTKLERDVAIKILPIAVAGDADRQARFQREAKFLAALNHHNIGAIYGLVDHAGITGLVLEIVDGRTLAERLADGAMPVDQALNVARQIAAALDTAHERGIIHRDLKPANIKLTSDGTVKVLDFGIAKSFSPPGTETPTRTSDGTHVGSVIGTFGYMSPEQARGFEIDRRTDVWAFGCVLFEMLTGRPAFAGSTTSDTIAAVLQNEPDWKRLPASTPPHLLRLLRRCLHKDLHQRLRDIGDASLELQDAVDAGEAPSPRRPRWRGWIAAALFGGAVTAAALLMMRDRASSTNLSKARLEQLTFDNGLTAMPALSPDAQLLVYASDRAGRGDLDLWLQQTGGGAPLRLTDDPADDQQPDFSPDGREIVFRSERGGGGLYVMPALGGAARRLVDDGRSPRYAPDGHHIAYWTGPWRGTAANAIGAVYTLDLAGGQPARIAADFAGARDPVWSPDGHSLLILGHATAATPVDLYWVPMNGGAPVRTGALDRNGLRADVVQLSISSMIIGAWTNDGVLISTTSGLWRVPISQTTGALSGEPSQLIVGTGEDLHGAVDKTGAVVFTSGDAPRVIERAPLNDTGRAVVLYTDARSGASRPSQTPDGSRILFDRNGPGYSEFWIRQEGAPDRLVVRAPELAANQVISPDGSRIAYTVTTGVNTGDGYVVNVDRGVPTRLCQACGVWGFLSNGRSIMVVDDNQRRLRVVDIESGQSRIVLQAASTLTRVHLSPDDRHLAFNVERSQWITNVRADRPTPQSEWHKVEQPTEAPRACGWSMDSQIAYLLLDTDGFRCLWGQRIDPKSGELIGKPFAVRHFHHTVTQEFSTSLGNAISNAGFLYGGSNLKANLFRLILPR